MILLVYTFSVNIFSFFDLVHHTLACQGTFYMYRNLVLYNQHTCTWPPFYLLMGMMGLYEIVRAIVLNFNYLLLLLTSFCHLVFPVQPVPLILG